jgi:hypothetical protein
MPNIAQVRSILANNEEVGMGFNSASGLAVGTPFNPVNVTADPTAPGQTVFSKILRVDSHEELMDHLNMSFDAEGRYGFFKASVKGEFADTTGYNSTSTFLVAKVIVSNPFLRGHDFTLTTAAQALINAQRLDEFATAFGDSFVRGLQTGGEFYTIVRLTSVSVTKQTELAGQLEGEYEGVAAGGSFKLALAKANESSNTTAEFEATMYQQAGSGPTIAPITAIEELVPRFKAFPTIARQSAVAYEAEVATYDTIPLPLPTPEEQDNFVFALSDTRDTKLRYIQARNDLAFALQHPEYFVSPPSNDVLTSTLAVYAKLINAVIDHADRLSRGEFNPPRIFDPSALPVPLAEPTPIALVRVKAKAAATIVVPDFTGFDRLQFDGVMEEMGIATIDQILAGLPNEVGVITHEPPNITRQVLEFFQLVMTTGPRLNHQTPPSVFAASSFEVHAQFPGGGSLVSPDDEVILQYVEIPAPT